MSMVYKEGKVSLEKGSITLKGIKTKFLNPVYNIFTGQIVQVRTNDRVLINTVNKVISDTEIELAFPSLETATEVDYVILMTTVDSISDAANKIIGMSKLNSEFSAIMSEWFSSVGDIEATLPNGENIKVPSISKIVQELDSKAVPEQLNGFAKVYANRAEADLDLKNRTDGDIVLVWNESKSSYGWYKIVEGALEKTHEDPKILSINNVKPDDTGNVQITLPSGNPSLWLGEVTLFPYDTTGVGYSGLLPADGQIHKRSDYPDMWDAIDKNLVSSVTEDKWLAGENMVFSKGDGKTTFRVPNLMQGQALSAGKKGDKGSKLLEQVPYISTVNGKSPNASGNIDIPDTMLPLTSSISGNNVNWKGRHTFEYEQLSIKTSSSGKNSIIAGLDDERTPRGFVTYYDGSYHELTLRPNNLSYEGKRVIIDGATDPIFDGSVEVKKTKNPYIQLVGTSNNLFSRWMVGMSGVPYVEWGDNDSVKNNFTYPSGKGTGATREWVNSLGLGVNNLSVINRTSDLYEINSTGLYGYVTPKNLPAGVVGYGNLLHLKHNSGSAENWSNLVIPNYGDTFLAVQRCTATTQKTSAIVMTSNMWTVDGSGFYKKSSPIVKIKPNGSFEVNEESEGASVRKVGVGIYLLEGVLGYNSDGAWGVNGGVSVPKDSNNLELVFIQDRVLPNGSIELRTYHRQHSHLPEMFQNKRSVDGRLLKDGEPCNIPDSTWLDVRVQMPEDSPYNLMKKKEEEARIRYECTDIFLKKSRS